MSTRRSTTREKGKKPARTLDNDNKSSNNKSQRRDELIQQLMEDDEVFNTGTSSIDNSNVKTVSRRKNRNIDKAKQDVDDLSTTYVKNQLARKIIVPAEDVGGPLARNQFIIGLSDNKKRALQKEGEILISKPDKLEEILKLNTVLEHIKYSWLNLPVDPKDATEFPEQCINCGNAFNGIAELTHFLNRLNFSYQVIFNRLGIAGTHDIFPCCRNELMNILPKEAMELDYDLIRGFKDLTVAEQEARERYKFDPSYTYAMKYDDEQKRKQSEEVQEEPNGVEYINVGCGLTAPVIKEAKMQTR